MMRYWPTIAGCTLLLAVGFIHSRWTSARHSAQAIHAAVERLDLIPRAIGDWEGDDDEIPEDQKRASGADGFVLRHYHNQRNGNVVTVLIVCGRPGPVAVHTPDVCYRAVGNLVGTPTDSSVELSDGESAHFKLIRVSSTVRKSAVPQQDVYWSWSADGNWTTPTFPRLAFARSPVLYKLYVIRQIGDNEPADDQSSVAFIQTFLPEAHKCLFADER